MAAEMLNGEADESTQGDKKLKRVNRPTYKERVWEEERSAYERLSQHLLLRERLTRGQAIKDGADPEQFDRERADIVRLERERQHDEAELSISRYNKWLSMRKSCTSSLPQQREDGPQQHFTWMDGLRTAGHKATRARVGHLPLGWKEIQDEHKRAQVHGWVCRNFEDNEDH